MTTDNQGRPIKFMWQSKIHVIDQIKQQWQIDTDWWDEQGCVWRDCFAVITTTGLLCVIYQDLLTENWYLSKIYD
jgi:hypothetical protein